MSYYNTAPRYREIECYECGRLVDDELTNGYGKCLDCKDIASIKDELIDLLSMAEDEDEGHAVMALAHNHATRKQRELNELLRRTGRDE